MDTKSNSKILKQIAAKSKLLSKQEKHVAVLRLRTDMMQREMHCKEEIVKLRESISLGEQKSWKLLEEIENFKNDRDFEWQMRMHSEARAVKAQIIVDQEDCIETEKMLLKLQDEILQKFPEESEAMKMPSFANREKTVKNSSPVKSVADNGNNPSFGTDEETVFAWIVGRLTDDGKVESVLFGQFTRDITPPSGGWIYIGKHLDRDLFSVSNNNAKEAEPMIITGMPSSPTSKSPNKPSSPGTESLRPNKPSSPITARGSPITARGSPGTVPGTGDATAADTQSLVQSRPQTAEESVDRPNSANAQSDASEEERKCRLDDIIVKMVTHVPKDSSQRSNSSSSEDVDAKDAATGNGDSSSPGKVDLTSIIYHVSGATLDVLNGRYLPWGHMCDAPRYRNVRGYVIFRFGLQEIPELGIYADGCYDAIKGTSVTALMDARADVAFNDLLDHNMAIADGSVQFKRRFAEINRVGSRTVNSDQILERIREAELRAQARAESSDAMLLILQNTAMVNPTVEEEGSELKTSSTTTPVVVEETEDDLKDKDVSIERNEGVAITDGHEKKGKKDKEVTAKKFLTGTDLEIKVTMSRNILYQAGSQGSLIGSTDKKFLKREADLSAEAVRRIERREQAIIDIKVLGIKAQRLYIEADIIQSNNVLQPWQISSLKKPIEDAMDSEDMNDMLEKMKFAIVDLRCATVDTVETIGAWARAVSIEKEKLKEKARLQTGSHPTPKNDTINYLDDLASSSASTFKDPGKTVPLVPVVPLFKDSSVGTNTKKVNPREGREYCVTVAHKGERIIEASKPMVSGIRRFNRGQENEKHATILKHVGIFKTRDEAKNAFEEAAALIPYEQRITPYADLPKMYIGLRLCRRHYLVRSEDVPADLECEQCTLEKYKRGNSIIPSADATGAGGGVGKTTSSRGGSNEKNYDPPPQFIWHDSSYLEKMWHDLDFLQENLFIKHKLPTLEVIGNPLLLNEGQLLHSLIDVKGEGNPYTLLIGKAEQVRDARRAGTTVVAKRTGYEHTAQEYIPSREEWLFMSQHSKARSKALTASMTQSTGVTVAIKDHEQKLSATIASNQVMPYVHPSKSKKGSSYTTLSTMSAQGEFGVLADNTAESLNNANSSLLMEQAEIGTFKPADTGNQSPGRSVHFNDTLDMSLQPSQAYAFDATMLNQEKEIKRVSRALAILGQSSTFMNSSLPTGTLEKLQEFEESKRDRLAGDMGTLSKSISLTDMLNSGKGKEGRSNSAGIGIGTGKSTRNLKSTSAGSMMSKTLGRKDKKKSDQPDLVPVNVHYAYGGADLTATQMRPPLAHRIDGIWCRSDVGEWVGLTSKGRAMKSFEFQNNLMMEGRRRAEERKNVQLELRETFNVNIVDAKPPIIRAAIVKAQGIKSSVLALDIIQAEQFLALRKMYIKSAGRIQCWRRGLVGRRIVKAMKRKIRAAIRHKKITEEESTYLAIKLIPNILEQCVATVTKVSIKPLLHLSSNMSGVPVIISVFYNPRKLKMASVDLCPACRTESVVNVYHPDKHNYKIARAICSCSFATNCESWLLRTFEPLSCTSLCKTVTMDQMRDYITFVRSRARITQKDHMARLNAKDSSHFGKLQPLFNTPEVSIAELKRLDRSPFAAKLQASKESFIYPLLTKTFSKYLLSALKMPLNNPPTASSDPFGYDKTIPQINDVPIDITYPLLTTFPSYSNNSRDDCLDQTINLGAREGDGSGSIFNKLMEVGSQQTQGPKSVLNVDTDKPYLQEPNWKWEPFTDIKTGRRHVIFLKHHRDILECRIAEAKAALNRCQHTLDHFRVYDLEWVSMEYEALCSRCDRSAADYQIASDDIDNAMAFTKNNLEELEAEERMERFNYKAAWDPLENGNAGFNLNRKRRLEIVVAQHRKDCIEYWSVWTAAKNKHAQHIADRNAAQALLEYHDSVLVAFLPLLNYQECIVEKYLVKMAKEAVRLVVSTFSMPEKRRMPHTRRLQRVDSNLMYTRDPLIRAKREFRGMWSLVDQKFMGLRAGKTLDNNRSSVIRSIVELNRDPVTGYVIITIGQQSTSVEESSLHEDFSLIKSDFSDLTFHVNDNEILLRPHDIQSLLKRSPNWPMERPKRDGSSELLGDRVGSCQLWPTRRARLAALPSTYQRRQQLLEKSKKDDIIKLFSYLRLHPHSGRPCLGLVHFVRRVEYSSRIIMKCLWHSDLLKQASSSWNNEICDKLYFMAKQIVRVKVRYMVTGMEIAVILQSAVVVTTMVSTCDILSAMAESHQPALVASFISEMILNKFSFTSIDFILDRLDLTVPGQGCHSHWWRKEFHNEIPVLRFCRRMSDFYRGSIYTKHLFMSGKYILVSIFISSQDDLKIVIKPPTDGKFSFHAHMGNDVVVYFSKIQLRAFVSNFGKLQQQQGCTEGNACWWNSLDLMHPHQWEELFGLLLHTIKLDIPDLNMINVEDAIVLSRNTSLEVDNVNPLHTLSDMISHLIDQYNAYVNRKSSKKLICMRFSDRNSNATSDSAAPKPFLQVSSLKQIVQLDYSANLIDEKMKEQIIYDTVYSQDVPDPGRAKIPKHHVDWHISVDSMRLLSAGDLGKQLESSRNNLVEVYSGVWTCEDLIRLYGRDVRNLAIPGHTISFSQYNYYILKIKTNENRTGFFLEILPSTLEDVFVEEFFRQKEEVQMGMEDKLSVRGNLLYLRMKAEREICNQLAYANENLNSVMDVIDKHQQSVNKLEKQMKKDSETFEMNVNKWYASTTARFSDRLMQQYSLVLSDTDQLHFALRDDSPLLSNEATTPKPFTASDIYVANDIVNSPFIRILTSYQRFVDVLWRNFLEVQSTTESDLVADTKMQFLMHGTGLKDYANRRIFSRAADPFGGVVRTKNKKYLTSSYYPRYVSEENSFSSAVLDAHPRSVLQKLPPSASLVYSSYRNENSWNRPSHKRARNMLAGGSIIAAPSKVAMIHRGSSPSQMCMISKPIFGPFDLVGMVVYDPITNARGNIVVSPGDCDKKPGASNYGEEKLLHHCAVQLTQVAIMKGMSGAFQKIILEPIKEKESVANLEARVISSDINLLMSSLRNLKEADAYRDDDEMDVYSDIIKESVAPVAELMNVDHVPASQRVVPKLSPPAVNLIYGMLIPADDADEVTPIVCPANEWAQKCTELLACPEDPVAARIDGDEIIKIHTTSSFVYCLRSDATFAYESKVGDKQHFHATNSRAERFLDEYEEQIGWRSTEESKQQLLNRWAVERQLLAIQQKSHHIHEMHYVQTSGHVSIANCDIPTLIGVDKNSSVLLRGKVIFMCRFGESDLTIMKEWARLRYVEYEPIRALRKQKEGFEREWRTKNHKTFCGRVYDVAKLFLESFEDIFLGTEQLFPKKRQSSQLSLYGPHASLLHTRLLFGKSIQLLQQYKRIGVDAREDMLMRLEVLYLSRMDNIDQCEPSSVLAYSEELMNTMESVFDEAFLLDSDIALSSDEKLLRYDELPKYDQLCEAAPRKNLMGIQLYQSPDSVVATTPAELELCWSRDAVVGVSYHDFESPLGIDLQPKAGQILYALYLMHCFQCEKPFNVCKVHGCGRVRGQYQTEFVHAVGVLNVKDVENGVLTSASYGDRTACDYNWKDHHKREENKGIVEKMFEEMKGTGHHPVEKAVKVLLLEAHTERVLATKFFPLMSLETGPDVQEQQALEKSLAKLETDRLDRQAAMRVQWNSLGMEAKYFRFIHYRSLFYKYKDVMNADDLMQAVGDYGYNRLFDSAIISETDMIPKAATAVDASSVMEQLVENLNGVKDKKTSDKSNVTLNADERKSSSWKDILAYFHEQEQREINLLPLARSGSLSSQVDSQVMIAGDDGDDGSAMELDASASVSVDSSLLTNVSSIPFTTELPATFVQRMLGCRGCDAHSGLSVPVNAISPYPSVKLNEAMNGDVVASKNGNRKRKKVPLNENMFQWICSRLSFSVLDKYNHSVDASALTFDRLYGEKTTKLLDGSVATIQVLQGIIPSVSLRIEGEDSGCPVGTHRFIPVDSIANLKDGLTFLVYDSRSHISRATCMEGRDLGRLAILLKCPGADEEDMPKFVLSFLEYCRGIIRLTRVGSFCTSVSMDFTWLSNLLHPVVPEPIKSHRFVSSRRTGKGGMAKIEEDEASVVATQTPYAVFDRRKLRLQAARKLLEQQ